MKAYYDFHPQVMHDLHESVPFLYISTGTGPFNPALDPMMIDEWHRMGFHEVDELTRRGLPGVWLHGFWDGWAPNYMFWLGAGRNTIAPLLRDVRQSLADDGEARRARRERARVVSPEPAAARSALVAAQQRQLPAVGAALRAARHGRATASASSSATGRWASAPIAKAGE